MIQEKINLRQSRDFGETFNTSVKFLRQNFKIIFLSVLCLAGPFILLSSVAGAFYQANVIQNALTPVDFGSGANPWDVLTRQFGIWYFIFLISASISQVILTTTVYGVMINYQEKGPGNFTVGDVASRVGRNFVNIVAAYFFLMFATILVVALLVAIIFAIASAVPALGIILGIFMAIGILIVGPTVFWQLSAVYLSVMQPNENLARGIGKPFRVTSGNFWWTWVIVVCTTIAVGLMGMVFAIPQGAYQAVIMFAHKGEDVPTAFFIVSTVCVFFSSLLYSVMHLVFGVHYYSLVEKKEGTGIMDRINEIGNSGPVNENLQY